MRSIRKILFATKFRELALPSLRSLMALRGAGLEEIILCHVIPLEEVGFVPFGGYLKDREKELRQEALMRFEDWQASLRQEGLSFRAVIEVGKPVPKILEVARAHGADLIVAGKKRKVMPESFVGSDMLHLLRESPLPVMVNKFMVEFKWKGERASRTNEAPFRRPLLAVDWTEASLKALRFLKALRGAVKEEVLLAHVLQEPLLRKLTPQELKAHKEAVGAKLQALRQELEAWGLKAQAHLLVGQPLKELLEAQRALGASMVIMGTTRKGTVKELFVGSLSHRMAEDSELPVLLVP